MKKFNSLVVAHLSPDVFHLGTELHTQVERVLNSGCNDYGRNSLLITAVTICTFPSQSPVLPRSVLGHRAGKQFMYHWNIDVICRKINDTTWIQISLTNNTSRGNPKGMIVHTIWLNSNIWWLSNVLAWHDQKQWMTKGGRSPFCSKKATHYFWLLIQTIFCCIFLINQCLCWLYSLQLHGNANYKDAVIIQMIPIKLIHVHFVATCKGVWFTPRRPLNIIFALLWKGTSSSTFMKPVKILLTQKAGAVHCFLKTCNSPPNFTFSGWLSQLKKNRDREVREKISHDHVWECTSTAGQKETFRSAALVQSSFISPIPFNQTACNPKLQTR